MPSFRVRTWTMPECTSCWTRHASWPARCWPGLRQLIRHDAKIRAAIGQRLVEELVRRAVAYPERLRLLAGLPCSCGLPGGRGGEVGKGPGAVGEVVQAGGQPLVPVRVGAAGADGFLQGGGGAGAEGDGLEVVEGKGADL